jgi:hypothetical protein
MTKPIYNEKHEVKVRYQLKDIKNKEWDDFYSMHSSYKFVCDLKEGNRVYGKRIIFLLPLLEGWAEDYEKENQGFKCLACKDTGVNNDNRFCSCELGVIAKKHFSENE